MMIKRYLVFCSVIHNFYVRKNESSPWIFVFFGTSLILSFNFLTIYEGLRYFFLPDLPFSKTISFVFFFVIAFLNYMFFIKPAKYKEIIPDKKDGLYSVIYIVITFLLIILIACLHRYRNVGYI